MSKEQVTLAKTHIAVFQPYGDQEAFVRDEIVSYLKNGWVVACVYGGNRPTVILKKEASMSDSTNSELREEIDIIWLWLSHGSNVDQKSVQASIDKTLDLITQSNLALLERLKENGHGGGNWRRLIEEELSKLQKEGE